MTVLIDPPTWPAHGTVWSHLVSDASLDELHALAAQLGLNRRAFDLDHYDVPAERYQDCLDAGVIAVSGRELVVRLRRSGLRVPGRERQAAKAETLSARWDALLPGTEAIGTDLLRRWQEPHRTYHGPEHLTHVLDSLAVLEGGHPGIEPAGLDGAARVARLALWFHDAVHAGVAGRDEEESAELAVALLEPLTLKAARKTGSTSRTTAPARPGAAPLTLPDVEEVARLVRLTAGHDPAADDALGALLCDADLAILGNAPDRYARYVRQVRAEYASVPDVVFRTARAEVLEQLLALPALFRTPVGVERWQARAEENLRTELAELRA